MGPRARFSSIAVLMVLTASIVRADPAPPAVSWAAHETAVTALAFSPDGKSLATFCDDGSAKLWDVATHKAIGSLDKLINGHNAVRFSPDGKILYALDTNDSLARLNTADGTRLPSLPLKSPAGETTTFDIASDGNSIAVVGRGSLRILSAKDGSELQNWVVHELYGIDAAIFSPDGKFVATAGTDHKCDVVECTTGKIPFEFATHLNGQFIAYARDAKRLYVANSDGSLQSLDFASGDVVDLGNEHTSILAVVPSADGKTLYAATGGHGPVVITPANTEPDASVFNTDGLVKTIALSPDGAWLAGGGQDGAVYLWKLSK